MPEALEAGYWRAYRDFYRWSAIVGGALTHERWSERLRHVAYAGGWKKCEPMWDLIIRAKRASSMLPVLETVLGAFGSRRPVRPHRQEHPETAGQRVPADLEALSETVAKA
jgi:hypothetical protein